MAATAEAGVLIAAIERIAVHAHRPRNGGPLAADLEIALIRLVLKGIR